MGLHVGNLLRGEDVVEDDQAGLLADGLHPEWGEGEVWLLVGGHVTLGLGGGAGVGHSLAPAQRVEIVNIPA